MAASAEPKLVGFDDPGSAAERVRALLRAAREATVPPRHPTSDAPGAASVDPAAGTTAAAVIEQTAAELARIADSLRRGNNFDRLTVAAALDDLQHRLRRAAC